jgi:hypothetical protein
VKVTVAETFPLVAPTIAGAAGTVIAVTDPLDADGPVPLPFVAVTVNVYD